MQMQMQMPIVDGTIMCYMGGWGWLALVDTRQSIRLMVVVVWYGGKQAGV